MTHPSSASRSLVTLLILALATLLLRSEAQSLPTPTEGPGYLPPPIPQPSIAGGAGTFNVVSLARSSNYPGPGPLVQTTTFEPGNPSYLAVESGTGTYNTVSGPTTNRLPPSASTSQASSSSSAAGPTGGQTDAARLATSTPPVWKGLLVSTFAVLAGAAWVAAS